MEVSPQKGSPEDDVGVAGYFVSESSTTPSADDAGWVTDAPSTYLFDFGGPKTLYAWAKDEAGNVSSRESANTTIDLSGTDLSGMEIWQGTWFRVNIRNADQSPMAKGFLNIQSWEEESQGLLASLFTESGKGKWQLSELMLHCTSGTPLRFLCWFDYAEEFAFSLSINSVITCNFQ